MVALADLTSTEKHLLASLGKHSPLSDVGGFVSTATEETLKVLIRDLEKQNKLEIISAPRFRMEDNEASSVWLRRTVLYSEPVRRRDVLTADKTDGLSIQFTPKINMDGTVAVRVMPKVSPAYRSKVEVCNGGGSIQTVYNLASLDVTVLIPNGETVVLGGPVNEYDYATEHKIPVLSDLPWVGSAFTRNTHEKQKSDLLIFITPHVEKAEK
jgi:type II secretory pathway component GspD/PulD (secretin)